MAKKANVKDALVKEEKVKKAKSEEEVKDIEKEVEDEKFEEEYEVDIEKEDKKKNKKDGFFASVRKEMKKVVWPSLGSVVKYSIAVIVFCLFLALFFELMDLFAAFVKGLF